MGINPFFLCYSYQTQPLRFDARWTQGRATEDKQPSLKGSLVRVSAAAEWETSGMGHILHMSYMTGDIFGITAALALDPSLKIVFAYDKEDAYYTQNKNFYQACHVWESRVVMLDVRKNNAKATAKGVYSAFTKLNGRDGSGNSRDQVSAPVAKNIKEKNSDVEANSDVAKHIKKKYKNKYPKKYNNNILSKCITIQRRRLMNSICTLSKCGLDTRNLLGLTVITYRGCPCTKLFYDKNCIFFPS